MYITLQPLLTKEVKASIRHPHTKEILKISYIKDQDTGFIGLSVHTHTLTIRNTEYEQFNHY